MAHSFWLRTTCTSTINWTTPLASPQLPLQTERHKDRKTERKKDRKTEIQKDRKTERQKDRKTERQGKERSRCVMGKCSRKLQRMGYPATLRGEGSVCVHRQA